MVNSKDGVQLDKSCRDCANFEQTTESAGTCRIESRTEQTTKLVDFISCFFFRNREGAT
jgi:hypothetical protein